MAADLHPEFILYHILTRVRGKSVLRFKCVSKQWHAFITTSMFKNMHLQYINEDNHQNPNLLLLSTIEEPCKLYTIDCEAPEDGLSICPIMPFETNPSKIHVLTSYHGLVCVGVKISIRGYNYSDLFLWNPLTREYKSLSKPNHCDHECYKIHYENEFRLYYSSFDDDYKILLVTHEDIYIYSLKSDSWRKLGSSKYIPYTTSSYCLTSIFLNEKIYFLREFKPLYLVLRFDTKTEKLIRIATPSLMNFKVNFVSLLVVRECIYFCVWHDYGEIKVWRMDEDGEWTKVVTYSKLISKCLNSVQMKPVHVMKNGNYLMRSSSELHGNYFSHVDPETNIKQAISCSYAHAYGIKDWCIIHRGKYIETFVSPNRFARNEEHVF